MKKFYEFLKEHAMKIKLLKKGHQELYENVKICYICNKKFENKYLEDKKYHKVTDNCHYTGEYRGAAHSICNLKQSVTRKFL